MSIFKSKTGITSKSMSALVYENAKHRTAEITPLFDKLGVLYDELENQLIIMSINYEIMRWELAKSHSKDKVNKVIDDTYTMFFNLLRIDPSSTAEYQAIMDNARKEIDGHLFLLKNTFAPKNELIFKSLIDLQDIHIKLIDRITEQEILLTIQSWFNLAKQVNDNYKIVDSNEDLKLDQPIDFDF